jgi:hypothetical protein
MGVVPVVEENLNLQKGDSGFIRLLVRQLESREAGQELDDEA